MNRRRLIGAGLAIAVVAAGVFVYFRPWDLSSPEQILARLPTTDASVLSIDFGALRSAGIFDTLNGAIAQEEPEYTAFVQKTGFHYQTDLDRAFLSFHPSGVYFLLTGRFDWKRLEAYATEQGGGCFNGLCRMQGSTPERKISYFRLKENLMALAVSPDDWAATRMNERSKGARPVAMLTPPIWLSLSSATLKKADSFPTGTQLFAKAMEGAESATLSIAPDGKALKAQLEVVCHTTQEAAILHAQFQRVTSVLRDLLAKERQKPGPGDLAGILTAGVFEQNDLRVTGRWPIERAFLDHLAGH